jgi:serine/threonine protein kinase
LSDLRAEQRIDSWTLGELLGEGGDPEVWRCGHRDGHEAAVKFLKTRKAESERWARFRREVEYVEGLGQRPGILPIDLVHLPDEVSRGERAWYSMPVATSLADALRSASLREVVEAVPPIARTLAELAAQDGSAHRDIKPGNLYLWVGESAIGDFGLVVASGPGHPHRKWRNHGPVQLHRARVIPY